MRTLVAAVLLLAAHSAAAIQPGDPAPDFTLVDINGNSHSLHDDRGRVVLLAFIGWG